MRMSTKSNGENKMPHLTFADIFLGYVAFLSLALLLGLFDYVRSKFLPRMAKVFEEADRVQRCGYLAPPPSAENYEQMRRVSSWAIRHFVGDITVVGKEKLDAMQGPFTLAFNHGSMLDTGIAPLVLGRPARYPAAHGVMKLLGGLVGWLFSKWGVFTVDLDNGHAALDASANVMRANQILVIFPEAWTWMDGVVRKMKTGAVRFTRMAAEESGKPVYIVPGYMHYHRYPGQWILKLPMALQWLIPVIFSFYYARGCTVVIGDAINTMDLPADPRAATEILREKIIALKPAV